jgi:hypothetical protein
VARLFSFRRKSGERNYIDVLLLVVVVVDEPAMPESADMAVPVSAGAATSVEVSVVVVVSAGFEHAAAVRASAAATSGRSLEVMLVFTWRSLLTKT